MQPVVLMKVHTEIDVADGHPPSVHSSCSPHFSGIRTSRSVQSRGSLRSQCTAVKASSFWPLQPRRADGRTAPNLAVCALARSEQRSKHPVSGPFDRLAIALRSSRSVQIGLALWTGTRVLARLQPTDLLHEFAQSAEATVSPPGNH